MASNKEVAVIGLIGALAGAVIAGASSAFTARLEARRELRIEAAKGAREIQKDIVNEFSDYSEIAMATLARGTSAEDVKASAAALPKLQAHAARLSLLTSTDTSEMVAQLTVAIAEAAAQTNPKYKQVAQQKVATLLAQVHAMVYQEVAEYRAKSIPSDSEIQKLVSIFQSLAMLQVHAGAKK